MKNIQQTGQMYSETITVKQISKVKALKLFADNKTVYFQSSNMRPFGIWQNCMPVKFDKLQLDSDIESYNWHVKQNFDTEIIPMPENPTIESQFNYMVINFTWYNCDNERGKYVNFYANIDDI